MNQKNLLHCWSIVRRDWILSPTWFLLLLLGTAERLLPHLPNAVGILALALFAGRWFSRAQALFLLMLILLVSDSYLTWRNGYAWGSWTFFTYSGTLTVAWLGSYWRAPLQAAKLFGFGITTCLGYWLWTNLGVFMFSDLYPHTGGGLVACYLFALPFLGNSLLANLVGMSVFAYAAEPGAQRQGWLKAPAFSE